MSHYLIEDDRPFDDKVPHYAAMLRGETPPNKWDDLLAELALTGSLTGRWVPADIVGSLDHVSSREWAEAVRRAHNHYTGGA